MKSHSLCVPCNPSFVLCFGGTVQPRVHVSACESLPVKLLALTAFRKTKESDLPHSIEKARRQSAATQPVEDLIFFSYLY